MIQLVSPTTIRKIQSQYDGRAAEFFGRVWGTPLEDYRSRLAAINFAGHERVLDAGFGVGQWMMCLSELNDFVDGIEYCETRVANTKQLIYESGVSNVAIRQGSIEELPYNENTFDAVFCYGVIFLTDFEATLQEFYRVLKPSGKLYTTANDIGYFGHCIANEHNKSSNHDPRGEALTAITDTIEYFRTGEFHRGYVLLIPQACMRATMETIGFRKIQLDHEGHINLREDLDTKSFYATEFYDREMVYEVLTEK